MAAAPIVYFEFAGPDVAALGEFYASVFEWPIGSGGQIPAAQAGAPRGGLRADPPATVLYLGVPDITATLAAITHAGGAVMIPRTVVPGVGTFALFRDPGGNVVGLAESGSFVAGASAS